MLNTYNVIYDIVVLLVIIGRKKLLSAEYKIEGTVVTVTECDSTEVTSYTESIAEQQQCTVVINNFRYTDKEDAIFGLELYFTSIKKLVGGGEIVKDGIQIINNKVYITFVESKG